MMKTYFLTLVLALFFPLLSQAEVMGRLQVGVAVGALESADNKYQVDSPIGLRLLYFSNPEIKLGLEASSFASERNRSVGIVFEKIFSDVIHTAVSVNKFESDNALSLGAEVGWEPAWRLPVVPSTFYRIQSLNNSILQSVNIGLGFFF